MSKNRLRSNHKVRQGSGKDRYYTKEDIFLSRLASIMQISRGEVKGLFTQHPRTILRVNPFSLDQEKLLNILDSQGIKLKMISWYENAYEVQQADEEKLRSYHLYHEGAFVLQDLSSLLPPLILNPKPKDRTLSINSEEAVQVSHVAEMTENRADITAMYHEMQYAKDIAERLEILKADSVKVIKQDNTELSEDQKEKYHKILLEAPSSKEGDVFLPQSRSLKDWSIKKIEGMTKIQLPILLTAFEMLRPGGVLIYTTGTLEPEENEGVLTKAKAKLKDRMELEQIQFTNRESFSSFSDLISSGIKKWSGNIYMPGIGKAIRIEQGTWSKGRFIAKIRKVS